MPVILDRERSFLLGKIKPVISSLGVGGVGGVGMTKRNGLIASLWLAF
jgi:hypothetical protein